jgi:thiamine biosynthesis lipoprotein
MPQLKDVMIEFEAIGTLWSIRTNVPLEKELADAVLARIETFDRTYSRFRKDALVWKLSEVPGSFDFPEDAAPLFTFYEQLYDVSKGKVTPLIGEMLERAGYDADYSLIPKKQQALPRWEDVLTVQGSRVRTTQPVTLDFGAAGKGYLVDIICEMLDTAGVVEYVVNASGDLRHKGNAENRVGLEDPTTPGTVIGVMEVKNRSLCASAINRRQWAGLHHVFDPDMMDATKEIIATWVLAESTMIADGLATALFFTEPSVLVEHFSFEYVRMHADGGLEYSLAFEAALF